MTIASSATSAAAKEPDLCDRVVDAYRQATHLSHEAQLAKSIAADAVDEGVHAAKRAIKFVRRGVETLEDLRDETAHRVKRQPLRAVSSAVGIGLVCGLALGWIARRSRPQ